MTVSQIITHARFLTNTNSATTTDANLLRSLSERNKQLIIEISKLKEGFYEERSTASLVADQEEYLLPDGSDAPACLRLKRLEVQWTAGGKWYPVTFYDINESSNAQDSTTINQEFDSSAPFADVFDESFFLRPVPTADMSNGLKLWYVKRPADFTATSDTIDTPKEYHRLLTDLVALDIRLMKAELSQAQSIQAEQAIYETLKRQVSPRISGESMVMKPAYENYD